MPCRERLGNFIKFQYETLLQLSTYVAASEALKKKERQDETQLMVCHQS
jgi:hypothetical protein